MIKKIRLLGIAAVFLITAVNLAAAQSAEELLGEIDTLKGRDRRPRVPLAGDGILARK